MNKNANKRKGAVQFSSIDPYLDSNIVRPTETTQSGKDFVSWGDSNNYPDYLFGLYDSVPTLSSVINGSVDYTCGNSVESVRTLQGDRMNTEGETIREIVEQLALDYFIYGGFAIQVIRTADGSDIAEIYAIPLRFLRSDTDGEQFTYSEEWGQKWGRNDKRKTYPKFSTTAVRPSSILYVKNVRTQVYPRALYSAAVVPCEIEKQINEFHLNSICNGFTGSLLVNFNNGDPETPQLKKEIVRDFNEMYSGAKNAGRIIFSWNASRDYATTLERLEVQDFGEKYTTLEKRSAQQIFTSFRAVPNLFGIPTENNGFSEEEYHSAFRLFNRTTIRPAQQRIVEALNKILGDGAVTITPFSIDENKTE